MQQVVQQVRRRLGRAVGMGTVRLQRPHAAARCTRSCGTLASHPASTSSTDRPPWRAAPQAMSEQQKAELKARLKDVMSRLMQRDAAGGAMRELYQLRK